MSAADLYDDYIALKDDQEAAEYGVLAAELEAEQIVADAKARLEAATNALIAAGYNPDSTL